MFRLNLLDQKLLRNSMIRRVGQMASPNQSANICHPNNFNGSSIPTLKFHPGLYVFHLGTNWSWLDLVKTLNGCHIWWVIIGSQLGKHASKLLTFASHPSIDLGIFPFTFVDSNLPGVFNIHCAMSMGLPSSHTIV